MPLNGPVTCILGPAIHFSASCRWVIKSVAIKMEHWLGKTYSHNWGVLWSWKEPAPIRLAGGGFGSLPTQFFLPNPQGVRKFKTSWGGKNKKKWQSHDCLVFWMLFDIFQNLQIDTGWRSWNPENYGDTSSMTFWQNCSIFLAVASILEIIEWNREMAKKNTPLRRYHWKSQHHV